MPRDDLDTALHAYRDGGISFAVLARTTAEDWRRLARYLMSKWEIPTTVTADDVQQELLLACWQHVGRWDPLRGVKLSRYVVWNACALAAAFIHRQREALRRRGTSPSRHPVLLNPHPRAVEPDEAALLDLIAPEEMLRDQNVVRLESVDEALASCEGRLAERCVVAFLDEDASLREATKSVFGHDGRAAHQMVRQAVEMAANAG